MLGGVVRGGVAALLVVSCGGGSRTEAFAPTVGAEGEATEGFDASGDVDGDPPDVQFDVGDTDTPESGGAPDLCKVNDDLDAIGDCDDQAPPDSFEPSLQWAYSGEAGLTQSVVTPLVANLTDDNGDGAIDLCDIPDIVVTGYGPGDGSDPYWSDVGKIIVIDGATGTPHFVIDHDVSGVVNPAIGDIDNDGVPEIVTAELSSPDAYDVGRLVAFEHDGTLAWRGEAVLELRQHPVALADLDADGDVEIMLGRHVVDHLGRPLWDADVFEVTLNFGQAITAADLDGDDDLEVIYGLQAYHHDGSPYYSVTQEVDAGHPHVADIDGDQQPEIVISGWHGLSIIEHDGTLTLHHAIPDLVQWRPAAIHDLDDDGVPEIMVGANVSYSALAADTSVRWSVAVDDGTSAASGTAFDFLGDGGAEAMYADETTLFVFGEVGDVLLTGARTSWTQIENPVVADVDNDGSAEIVVVSNLGYGGGEASPMVQVYRDAQDRWVQARRIWNQHAYHVTNVREDGTIPRIMAKHWLGLNTFRTQSQIASGGGVCDPKPEG